MLLRATPPPFVWEHESDDRASSIILHVVAGDPTPDLVQVLQDVMPDLDKRTRPQAVRSLGEIGTRDAVQLMLDTLATYLPTGEFPQHLFGSLYWLRRRPVHPDIVFPRLLEFRSYPEVGGEVDLVVSAYLREGLIGGEVLLDPPELLDEIISKVQAYRRDATKRGESLTREGSPWWTAENHQERRFAVAELISILGFVDTPRVRRELVRLEAAADPSIRLAVTLGLLRLGEPVADEAIAGLASIPEVRLGLFEGLAELGLQSRFPPEYSTQVSFAEAGMVQWLCSPAELGGPPDEIELAASFSGKDEDGDQALVYVFRFRAQRWIGGGDQWLAGVAGPYLVSEAPSPHAEGTFSDFQPFESATAEEHLERIVGQLDELYSSQRDS
jgi:hypothetical protein